MDETGLLLDRAREWRAAGHRLAIATVVRTWGSAPRRTGSQLLVRDDGLFEGSVSGGCVEGAVIEAALARISRGGGELLTFGVANETAWEVGLACGGEIAIYVQAVAEGGFPPELLEKLATARTTGKSLTLGWDFAAGSTTEAEAGDFVHRFDPPQRLMLVGAVHISQALAPMAQALGYQPLLVDPRGAFAAGPRFAGFEVDSRWPDEAMADWKPDSATAVVTLTHDPKLDDVALAAALRSPAFYIAALGSRKTHAARLERLAAQGFGEADLARIHGPAGLHIGAANPAEIALSVAAQMVASWRGPK
ncbi:XdhC family protein [Sandaracinobacteroides hominis]|uniref:XdhC family protein n=1 Tax=Sandaracinobacteroides hominis TaxID=2780086 RepID=UPI0018F70F99|nr:XdhC family protein [Sandaracinobacteroides hominis]